MVQWLRSLNRHYSAGSDPKFLRLGGLVWMSRGLHGFRGPGLNRKVRGHCGVVRGLQRLNRCCGLTSNRKARRWYASVWKAQQAARLLRRWIERKPETLRLDLEGATRLTACCALNFSARSPSSLARFFLTTQPDPSPLTTSH